MMITNNNCQRYRRGHFCPFRSSYCLLPIAHPSGGTAPVGCVGPTLSQRRWFEEVSQELLPHFFPSSMMMLIHCYLSVCRSLYPNRLFYCSSSIHPSHVCLRSLQLSHLHSEAKKAISMASPQPSILISANNVSSDGMMGFISLYFLLWSS